MSPTETWNPILLRVRRRLARSNSPSQIVWWFPEWTSRKEMEYHPLYVIEHHSPGTTFWFLSYHHLPWTLYTRFIAGNAPQTVDSSSIITIRTRRRESDFHELYLPASEWHFTYTRPIFVDIKGDRHRNWMNEHVEFLPRQGKLAAWQEQLDF